MESGSKKLIRSYKYPSRYRLHRCAEKQGDFERLFRFSPDGIMICGRSGELTRINPAMIWMLGIEDERKLSENASILDFLSNGDKDIFISCLEMILTKMLPATRMEATFLRTDGSAFPAEVAFGLFNDSTNPTSQIIIHDISDYKSSEEQNMRAHMELEMSYTATLNGWSRALELRDRETQGHSSRVTNKTIEIALRIGISMEKIIHVRHGALLHDIGKMAIPDSILFKPGPLSTYERNVMEQHPTYAYNLLSPIKYLQPALTIPYSHHEKWDGTGYPQGLVRESIPVEARIFSIVDVWDALTSDRPYRSAWAEDKTRQYIWENRSVQFDPELVDMFFQTL